MLTQILFNITTLIGPSKQRVTLRSHYGIGVGFDKMFVFCGKFCVLVIKIKCVSSSNVSNICNKLEVTTNYIYFTATDTHFIKHRHKLQFLTSLTGQSCHGT